MDDFYLILLEYGQNAMKQDYILSKLTINNLVYDLLPLWRDTDVKILFSFQISDYINDILTI